MRPELLRARRFELGARATVARRQMRAREPSEASQQREENRGASFLGARLDLVDGAARERHRRILDLGAEFDVLQARIDGGGQA